MRIPEFAEILIAQTGGLVAKRRAPSLAKSRKRDRTGERFAISIMRPSRIAKEGEITSNATYPLKLSVSIKKAAQRLAKEDGVSLNQWIAAAVAQKVGVVETAADFFEKRAGKATGAGLMKFLRTAPKAAPEPEDEMW